MIGVSGIVAGAIGGTRARARGQQLISPRSRFQGPVPIVGAAAVLVAAAILASLVPAARASRVDVISALRAE